MSLATPLVTDVDTKLLTYAELADALGIAPASAKRLAIRRGWQKTPGNDGKARVAVPIERLEIERRPTGDSPSDDTDDDPGDVTPSVPSDDTGDRGDTELPAFLAATAVLTQHIERLERELSESKAALVSMTNERDLEREASAQVDVLKAILEAERQRTTELQAERDLERTKAVRVDTLQAVLEAEQRRSTELRDERDKWQALATASRGGLWGWLRRSA